MDKPAYEKTISQKIIFLDIDGVLNSSSWNAVHQMEICDGTLVDKDKICLLAKLVKETTAALVLHSGWRFWFDKDLKPVRKEAFRLLEMLHCEGLSLYSITPDLSTDKIRYTKKFSLVKANEILSWLKHHPEAGRWIVIDDLDLHNDIIRQHQIKTDQTVGLTSQDIEHAKVMLMDNLQI